MTSLAPERGVLRVRLEEPQWRTAYDAAGSPDGLGALGPLVEDGTGEPPDDLTRAAIGDLVHTPVRVELTGSRDGIGAVGAFAVGPESAVGLVRALGGVDARLGAVPGVELSLLPVDRLVDELMRLVPESADAWRDTGAVVMPAEHATALVKAARTGDARLLAATLDVVGLPALPEVLDHLAATRGDLTVVVTREQGSVRHLRLLLTERGWVRLDLDPVAGLTHEPLHRRRIAELLTWSLAAALRPADLGTTS